MCIRDRGMSDPVGQFLHAAGDFDFFEEGQRAAKVVDLAPAALAQGFDLLRRESEAPEHSRFALAVEPGIELIEARGVAEAAKVQLLSRAREMNRLREDFHQFARPE